MLKLILNWILKNAGLSITSSNIRPEGGIQLGGHDVPDVRDEFVVLHIWLGTVLAFTGYWQRR